VDKPKEIRSGRSARKSKGLTRGDIAVFAFFLCLSFVFWYLNSLGKDIETNIRYPLTYTNIPGSWKINDGNTRKVNLAVKGPGYSILQMKMSGKRSPLLIDLSKVHYRQLQNSKKGDYFIISSSLIPGINSRIKSGCKVISVKPDTLFLTVK